MHHRERSLATHCGDPNACPWAARAPVAYLNYTQHTSGKPVISTNLEQAWYAVPGKYEFLLQPLRAEEVLPQQQANANEAVAERTARAPEVQRRVARRASPTRCTASTSRRASRQAAATLVAPTRAAMLWDVAPQPLVASARAPGEREMRHARVSACVPPAGAVVRAAVRAREGGASVTRSCARARDHHGKARVCNNERHTIMRLKTRMRGAHARGFGRRQI